MNNKSTNNLVTVPRPIALDKQHLDKLAERFVFGADVRPATQAIYFQGVQRFNLWLVNQNILHPRREDLIEYKRYLKEVEGLADTSISTYFIALRRYFSFLQDELVYPNIAATLKTGKKPRRHLRSAPTIDQMERLLSFERKTLRDYRDFALIFVLGKTGIRISGAVGATMEDLAVRNGRHAILIQNKGSSTKDFPVFLEKNPYNALMDYLAMRRKKIGALTEADALFGGTGNNNKNLRMTVRGIRQAINERFNDVGIKTKRLVVHSLRHLAASSAVEGMREIKGSADIRAIQSFLDHSSIDTTNIYLHADDRSKDPAEKYVLWDKNIVVSQTNEK